MEITYSLMLSILERKFISYSKERLKEVDLNIGMIPFILYIGKYEGTTQASLTKATHMDWGHSQRVVTKLVDNGYITKTQGTDKSYHLALTELGLKAYHLIKSLFKDFDEELLKDFSDEEKESLKTLLLKLVRPIEEMHSYEIR